MTDHLHPDTEPTNEETIASAFVDDQVTPEEAALVQATSNIQAMALSYLTLRAELADAGTSEPVARDLAVNAALAEFDALAAVPTGAAATAVVHLSTRRQWPTRVLAAAAAVAILGVAGVVVFGGNDRNSQNNTASRSGDTAVAAESQDVAGGAAPSTIGAINGSADYAAVIDTPQQLHDLAAPPAATPTALTTDENATSAPIDAKYTTPGSQCLSTTQVFLASIVDQGSPAIAARDTVTGVTQAIDEQCRVLVEVAP